LALIGGLTAACSDETLGRITGPLIALAAGALIGGALFHLLPESLSQSGPDTSMALTAVGFALFLVLEQTLEWHRCRDPRRREPRDTQATSHSSIGPLILLGDGLHNFIGGLSIASAFLVDLRLGLVTWLVAAAHEVPQELGDFGVLVHSGFSRRRALLWNVISALPFLAGNLITLWAAVHVDVAPLLSLAAGSFLYIGAADLVPEVRSLQKAGRPLVPLVCFLIGLLSLYGVALLHP
ncbi:MAG: ZIP family metal transporter, partial [Myxococcota bacterium]